MSDMMRKLLEKKSKSKPLSDSEQEAKMSVLHQMKNSMDEVMSERANGLKKVSVMSDSKDGLQAGLDKAKDIIQGRSSEFEQAREDLPSLSPDSDELNSSDDDMEELSEEEIDEKLAKLMALKEKLKA